MKTPLTPPTLVVIDDDRIFCDSLRDYLQGEGMEVLVAHTGRKGLEICSQRKVDVVLLDQKLPDGEGQTLCPSILGYYDQTKIIFITAYPSFNHAVAALKAGAHDYLSKPFELQELKLAIDQALRTLELEKVEQLQRYKSHKESKETVIIGQGEKMAEVKRLVNLAASAEAPVLLTGETGTGKNVVARTIHYQASPKKAAFISINCAALPENLIEAELFGYEKGAFTGAVATHKGVFEMAEGGTLFLDEIGSMPLPLQSKLLSVLEEKKIKRLGGTAFRPADVRIIAATNTDLERAVKDKTFREDLYYRLNVIRIHLPPLRERRQDLPELCDYLLQQVGKGPGLGLAKSEVEKLMEYPWPGNVRELKNILERAALLQKGPDLQPSLLLGMADVPREEKLPPPALSPGAAPTGTGSLIPLEEVEKNYIRYVLERQAGNYTRTAQALGISLSTLKRKVKLYGLA